MQIKDLFLYRCQTDKASFAMKEATEKNVSDYEKEQKLHDEYLQEEVSADYARNLQILQTLYHYPKNSDIFFREFVIRFGEEDVRAFALFIDGMVSSDTVAESIIKPMLSIPRYQKEEAVTTDLKQEVGKRLICANQLEEETKMEKVVHAVNIGCCIVIVDTVATCFVADVKHWEHRPVSEAENEQTVSGPKEAFNEVIRTNTALVRKILNTEKLMIETYQIGSDSKTTCVLMYIQDIANESLVKEARRRLNGVRIDYLISSEELVQFLEEKTFILMPQILQTERPDRVARVLTEGRVAIMVHGSPTALVVPVNFFEFLYSPEDLYSRFFSSNMVKIVRLIGLLLSVLLPSIYITFCLYQPEMVPTFLLYTIQAAQANVPFSTLGEIVIMEIAFELIREASIRVPGTIGPTLGIVGGLILGQASVEANLISSVAIVVVAITGIGSFATSNYQLGLVLRVLRFVFILLVSISGIMGLSIGVFLYALVLVSNTSFGIPILAPIAPKTRHKFGTEFFIRPLYQYEMRDDYLNTKKKKRQPPISRTWAGRRK